MAADGSSHNSAPPLDPSIYGRLSGMMFLQYAIWGAWLPLLWPFLSGHRGLSGGQIGNIFAVGALGAIIAPFIAGQIADRWFNTEKFLAISHILGGLLVWQLSWIDSYQSFMIFSLLYSIISAANLLAIGRSSLYALIAEGKIRPVKVGRRTLLSDQEIRRFVKELELHSPESDGQ